MKHHSRFFVLGFFFLVQLTILGGLNAQTGGGNDFALDFHVGQANGDFNLGIGAKSPTFLEILNVQAFGDLAWKEAVAPGAAPGSTIAWNLYETVKLGVNIEADALKGIGRLYTGFGALMVLPGNLSAVGVQFGSYGIFGFDFWLIPSQTWSYFIELGGNLSFATAELLTGSPELQNGFSINSGVRYHF